MDRHRSGVYPQSAGHAREVRAEKFRQMEMPMTARRYRPVLAQPELENEVVRLTHSGRRASVLSAKSIFLSQNLSVVCGRLRANPNAQNLRTQARRVQ